MIQLRLMKVYSHRSGLTGSESSMCRSFVCHTVEEFVAVPYDLSYVDAIAEAAKRGLQQ